MQGARMRTIAIVLGVVILGAIAVFFSGLIKFDDAVEQAAAAPCLTDDAIDPAVRTAANDAATAFYDKLLKGDATARDDLTEEAKKLVATEVFDAMMRTIGSNGPYSDLTVEHTYQPTITGAPGRITCTGDSDATTVSLSTMPDATQTHTLFTAKTRNNDWSLTTWMVQKDKAWRVHAFYVSMRSIVGHTASNIFGMAEEQAKKGHAFNAYLLYAVAKNLADRGPNIDLGLKQTIDAALKKQTPPPELKGKPPFTWDIEGATFPIEFVALVGTDKKLGLTFLHRDPSWDGKDTGKAERRNKRLIDGFVKTHPEYSEVFSYISARILEPGKDSGWGTVFDATKGYDTGEPSITKKKPK
jgi:hypothetical protein